jgi:hypothetical protein
MTDKEGKDTRTPHTLNKAKGTLQLEMLNTISLLTQLVDQYTG